jgi:hypothetical protein
MAIEPAASFRSARPVFISKAAGWEIKQLGIPCGCPLFLAPSAKPNPANGTNRTGADLPRSPEDEKMSERPEIPTGISLDLINIVVNTQSLCLQHALKYIAKVAGPEAALRFKESLLEAVKHGSIDMALLEDAAIFDFVVSMIDSIPTPEHRPE